MDQEGIQERHPRYGTDSPKQDPSAEEDPHLPHHHAVDLSSRETDGGIQAVLIYAVSHKGNVCHKNGDCQEDHDHDQDHTTHAVYHVLHIRLKRCSVCLQVIEPIQIRDLIPKRFRHLLKIRMGFICQDGEIPAGVIKAIWCSDAEHIIRFDNSHYLEDLPVGIHHKPVSHAYALIPEDHAVTQDLAVTGRHLPFHKPCSDMIQKLRDLLRLHQRKLKTRHAKDRIVAGVQHLRVICVPDSFRRFQFSDRFVPCLRMRKTGIICPISFANPQGFRSQIRVDHLLRLLQVDGFKALLRHHQKIMDQIHGGKGQPQCNDQYKARSLVVEYVFRCG